MLSTVFLFFFVLFINASNCSSPINFYINTKSNDSFYQDEPQNPVNIFNFFNTVFNIDGKDVDIKKLLKLNDDNTVQSVLNVNNTEPTSNQNITNASEVTTMSTTTTTAIQNKDKEVEKELKVRDDYTLYPGHGYYKYHNNNGVNWNQARDICVKEGTHLVVINSQAEADLLTGILKTNKVTWIPIGFYRTSTNSELVTVLGGRVSDSGYNKWHSSYPRADSGWDCGYMTSGVLFNEPCSHNFPFICEIEI